MPVSLPYDDTPDQRWSDQAVMTITVSPAPSPGHPYVLDLDGTCPRCQDHMRAEHWLISFSGVSAMDRDDKLRAAGAIDAEGLMPGALLPAEFAVRCTCKGNHQMPDGTASPQGCGAAWVMRVEPT